MEKKGQKASCAKVTISYISIMLILFVFIHTFAFSATEELRGIVIVMVRSEASPIASAEVSTDELLVQTDEGGKARLTLPVGEHTITISRHGFVPAAFRVMVRAGAEIKITVQLQVQKSEEEVVVVHATRSATVVEDQPIHVEAVPEEEIEENLTIAPGNVTTLLNELPGLRFQAAASSLGGVNLRIHGLRGRYTQILLDELPLYGEQPDEFSLLQIPPLDLAQVEIIKGTCSALYGGAALGGLLNLVSKDPNNEPLMLLNQSSQRGTDAVSFVPHKLGGGWGYTLLGGAHRQSSEDVDDDGWIDIPGYWRTELRPRFYWNNEGGDSLFSTVGVTIEDREGGTIKGATTSAGTPFHDDLATRRVDGGTIGRFLLQGDRLLIVRASFSGLWHDRHFGDERNKDRLSFALAEATLTGTDHGHTWVAGAALQNDEYHSQDFASFNFTRLKPALFVQDEYSVAKHLRISASVRLDRDHQHGRTFLSPLISALIRPGEEWNVRISAGSGYYLATPLIEETESISFSSLLPLQDVNPEHAMSSSLDVGWSRHNIEVNGTAFFSEVRNQFVLRNVAEQPDIFEITNAHLPTRTFGSELLARFTAGSWHLIATHTFIRSKEANQTDTARRDVPLTPHQMAEIAVIWEKESLGRAGFELSYTGQQHLEDDPYRDVSEPYLELNVLTEFKVGRVRIFVNGINITDVRQTHFDPLLLPARAPDGRWTTDVWAPLEGRVFNIGMKLEF